jgi:hypothetical protein
LVWDVAGWVGCFHLSYSGLRCLLPAGNAAFVCKHFLPARAHAVRPYITGVIFCVVWAALCLAHPTSSLRGLDVLSAAKRIGILF